MLTYFVRRVFLGCITLLLISLLIYWLIRHMPGTPLTMDVAVQSADKRISQADLERLNKIYGLDKPWYIAYFTWLDNLTYGESGTFVCAKAARRRTIIGERIFPTLLLSGTSLFLTYLLSVPLGIWSTAQRGKLVERGVSTLLYMLYSLPAFVAALLLLIVFYKNLGRIRFSAQAWAWSVKTTISLPAQAKCWILPNT